MGSQAMAMVTAKVFLFRPLQLWWLVDIGASMWLVQDVLGDMNKKCRRRSRMIGRLSGRWLLLYFDWVGPGWSAVWCARPSALRTRLPGLRCALLAFSDKR